MHVRERAECYRDIRPLWFIQYNFLRNTLPCPYKCALISPGQFSDSLH
jgi:hypothetical protein